MWVPEGSTSSLACYLILVFSQCVLHPQRSLGLVGVGSGYLPERVRETLKVPRITLSFTDSILSEGQRFS